MKSTLFQGKSIIYDQYRPNYPSDLIEILGSKSFLKDNDIVAEFGCGTGKLTTLLLNNGNVVYGVESDREMFNFLINKFYGKDRIHLINKNAENSNLLENSIDIIICGQAFHLFNAEQAKKEFYRIIKKGGFILLLWYFIDESNPIAKEIRSFFYQYQDHKTRQKINLEILQKLFYPNVVIYEIVNQFKQIYSNEGFINSMLSSSYAPRESNPSYCDYVNVAQSIYDRYSNSNNRIEYDFKIHLYSIKME